MKRQPYKGEVVLYCVEEGSHWQPVYVAIIREVNEDNSVDLSYFTPYAESPVRFAYSVMYDSTSGQPAPGMFASLNSDVRRKAISPDPRTDGSPYVVVS